MARRTPRQTWKLCDLDDESTLELLESTLTDDDFSSDDDVADPDFKRGDQKMNRMCRMEESPTKHSFRNASNELTHRILDSLPMRSIYQ